jgi:hypothetical protein
VSLSLTIVFFSLFLSMSMLCLCPWMNFALLFQPTSLATDNFQRLCIYCQKNQRKTFKVIFIANRQLSALISP